MPPRRSRDEDEEEDDDRDDGPRRVRLPRPRIRIKGFVDLEEHVEALHDKLDGIIQCLDEQEDDDDDDSGEGWVTPEQKALMAEHVVKPLMVKIATELAKPDGLAELLSILVEKIKGSLGATRGNSGSGGGAE